ncbi:fimbria/pilus outer membrane usher protein [Enterobacter ludwigii]|uniref:fimbria/pilus outer membrane usher protein n=1 Tax=Enterobacter ludwigii TaxID=299767 RepID=UPI0030766BB0
MNKNRLKTSFQLRPVSAWVLCMMAASGQASGREYFNPAFLGAQAGNVDLSAFEGAGYVPPGRYMVDIYMNQNRVDTREVNFKDVNGKTEPELTLSQLSEWGVDVKGIPALQGKPPGTAVPGLSSLIPQASSKFDFQHLRLDLSVPQQSMRPDYRGWVDPSLWDDGVPALMSSYSISGTQARYDNDISGSRNDSLFATFRNGLNVGPWRLRSTQTYTYSDTKYDNDDMSTIPAQRQWRTSNTYVQRGVAPLRGELTAGETSTGGDVFDSIPFRGVQLASDDALLPDSQQGFAPVISGTANSNATVTISQNGYTVYQTSVAPGPFRITDLYATGGAGDLTVSVKEADGTTHVSTVPYSSLPVMQREGGVKYEVTMGKYHGGNMTDGSREPKFAMGTLLYGLPHDVTAYGGGLVASNYQSGVVGMGVSLGDVGSLSADVTQARAQLQGGNDQSDVWKTGQSYRVRYSKSLMSTGTGIDLAAYRYSTKDFYSFSDVNSMGYSLNRGEVPWALDRRRSTLSLNLRQSLGSFGSIYLSGSQSRYWGNSRTDNNLSAGYNTMMAGISLGLSYTIDRIKDHGDYPENRTLSANVQIPFSIFGPQQALQNLSSSYDMSHDNQGNVTQNAGVNGSFLDNRLSWNAQQGWGNGSQSDRSSLYLNYQGSEGNASLGYSNGGGNKNVNYGLNGALLVHPHGVTLARSLSDGAILVRAPGAPGAMVTSGGMQTDWRGYAVVPSVSPYRKNSVSLDPTTLPDGADIEQTSMSLYPTRGAVVMADYKVRVGDQLLMTLLHDGRPVPFGAMATLAGADGGSSGIVGDGGRVYLPGMPPEGRVQVKWGTGSDQQCSTRYRVTKGDALSQISAQCQ